MASNQTTFRPFRWDDLDAFAALQKARVADVQRWLRQPNLEPERDCILAYAGEAVLGYAYVVAETALSRGVLTLGLTEGAGVSVARALQGEAASAARGLGLDVLQIDVPEPDSAMRSMCEETAMRHVRTHHHMRRDSREPAVAAMPRDGTVRLAEREDVASVTELQNAAFTGSWGYAPNTPEEIGYRIFDLPSDPPDPVLLLEVAGELVGYCWAHRETPSSPGIVGMVGVMPDRQGKGYGKAATGAGINHLLSIGATPIEVTVDSENGPAIRVYEEAGFTLDQRSFWYELALR